MAVGTLNLNWNTPEIRVVRDALKTQLAFQRRQLFLQGYLPYCSYCDGPLTNNQGEMHEWLVTRGDAQGWPEADRLLIFVELNCVLLHPVCHQQYGQSAELRRAVGRKQVKLYGQRAYLDWLPTLPWRGSGAQEHIHLINELGELSND